MKLEGTKAHSFHGTTSRPAPPNWSFQQYCSATDQVLSSGRKMSFKKNTPSTLVWSATTSASKSAIYNFFQHVHEDVPVIAIEVLGVQKIA